MMMMTHVLGDPTPPGSPGLATWLPVVAGEEQEYLRIDRDSGMEMDPGFRDRVNFWSGIMEQRPGP